MIHIDACPTPENKTIDYIRYDGQRVTQLVYEGKLMLEKYKYALPIHFAAMYCDQYHYKVTCEKAGQLMPANLTKYGLIRVRLSLNITRNFFDKTYCFVNSRMFFRRAVAIRVSPVSWMCYCRIP